MQGQNKILQSTAVTEGLLQNEKQNKKHLNALKTETLYYSKFIHH